MIRSTLSVRNVGIMVASLALGAALTLTGPASGQFGASRGFQQEPSYTSRDIQLAVDELKLDEIQKLIVETLFQDYQGAYDDSRAGLSQRITDMGDKLQGMDRVELLQVVFGALGNWQQHNERLSEQFIQDVRRLLSEDQEELWPSFEHKMYRRKYLKNGRLSGERLDLFVVMAELDLAETEAQEIQPLLDAYEVELDGALHRREEQSKSSQADAIAAIRNNNETNVGVVLANRQVQLHKVVRDVNEHYVQSIAAALPQEQQAAFLDKVRLRSFSRVYRLTLAQRVLKAAQELRDLTEELLIAIGQLESQYLIELAAFNEKLVQLIKDKEPQDIVYKASVQQSKLTGEGVERPADQTKEAFTKRRELGQRYIDQLKAMLTPEQIALLPGLGTFRPDGLATGSASQTTRIQDLKKARQERLRQLKDGPSIQPSSDGSLKQKGPKREADN
ncbi:MAG: hypothetical protein IIB99_00320 [Planctomycetes bacterium]|nr:hypothetical protein [Planctomycetota bacterium]